MKKLIYAAVFLGTILACYRISLVINGVLLPSDVVETLVPLVEETKVIKIPGLYGHTMNPGITKYENGYLMSFRTGSIGIISWIKRHLKLEKETYICFIKLNKDFKPVGKLSAVKHTSLLDSDGYNLGEDPRLIVFQDKIYVFYNDLQYGNTKDQFVKRMHMAEVVDRRGKFSLKNITLLNFVDAEEYYRRNRSQDKEQGVVRQFEKNWGPFIYQNELYLVYLLEPHVILKPNLETGECRLLYENEEIDICPRGMARGGTPAIRIGNEYIAFYHTLLRARHRFPSLHKTPHPRSNAYCFSAYSFDAKPPFSVKRKLSGYIGGKGLYNERRKMVFPSGSIVEGDNIYLFSGINDQKMTVSRISKQKLLKALEECKQDTTQD